MNYGVDYYNESFLPIFIFTMLGLFVLSQNIIKITGNHLIDELLFLPLIICAFFSTGNRPFQFVLKVNNKFVWFFLILFIFAGTGASIINKVPINIAIRGGLLISKPIILLISFLILVVTPHSRAKFSRYLRFFFCRAMYNYFNVESYF